MIPPMEANVKLPVDLKEVTMYVIRSTSSGTL
jgi:hypothetical protein